MNDAGLQTNGEASVGTFIKELDGSDQGLTTDGAENLFKGDHGILSFKSIQRKSMNANNAGDGLGHNSTFANKKKKQR